MTLEVYSKDGFIKRDDGMFIPRSLLTTKGDLLTRDGSDVKRLPIGSAGSVLTANSSGEAAWVGTKAVVVGFSTSTGSNVSGQRVIPLASVVSGDSGMKSGNTVVAPENGFYAVTANVYGYWSASVGENILWIIKNGSSHIATSIASRLNSGSEFNASCSSIVYLSQGDYVGSYAYASTTAALTPAAYANMFAVALIGRT